MYVKVCVAVRLADALRVNIVEPIVGDNFTGSIQDQAAQGIALIGVGIYSPIAPLKVLTDTLPRYPAKMVLLARGLRE